MDSQKISKPIIIVTGKKRIKKIKKIGKIKIVKKVKKIKKVKSLEHTDTTKSMNDLLKEYIDSLDNKSRQAYKIAKEHLETSFDLSKSIGFRQYIQKYN